MSAIAYQTISNCFGVAIYDVNDEEVVAAFVTADKTEKPRRHKLYFNKNGEPFFNLHCVRYYLKNFLRV